MKESNSSSQSVQSRLISRMRESRFLTISLLIHVGIISLLGGVVLFQATRQPENFVAVGNSDGFLNEQADDPAQAEEVTEFEEPAEAAPVSPSEAVSPASAISSLTDSTSSWSTSASADYSAFGNNLGATHALTTGTGTGGGRSGTGTGKGGGGKMGTLFGLKIETKKLGVVLDVSGSAHPYLGFALAEIGKSFDDAPTVLYLGCGMVSSAEAKDYEVKRAKGYSKELEKGDPEIPILNIVAALMRQQSDTGKGLTKLMRGQDVFLTISDKKTPQIVGCQHALEKLISEEVDTIYWFADFGDKVDEEVAKRLASKLRAKGIKLIAHNFAGKPVPPLIMTIVERTGGQAISKVPGK